MYALDIVYISMGMFLRLLMMAWDFILVPQYLLYNILHFAVITVGYVDTSVTVFEDAGVAQLTVAISVPPGTDPIETSFSLLVNTNDGTAAGLSSCLEFDLHTHTHLSATESLTI